MKALAFLLALASITACAPRKARADVVLSPVIVAQAPTATPSATAAAAASPSPSPTPRKLPSETDTSSLPKEALKPIDIDADVFEVNAKEKKGVFRGNVVARQGDVTIRAMRVEVLYSKQANAVVKAVAEGGVTVTSGTKVGKADHAEFNNDQRTVVLSGEPRLWEEGSLLEGREIIFHVDDGRVECFECSMDLDPTRLQEMQDDIRRTPAPGP